MFDPTKEVPRLDLCQQLKRLGFPQETGGFYWRKFKDGWKVDYIPYISVVRRMVRQGVIIKAPTNRELGEYLPVEINNQYHIKYSQDYKNYVFIYWYQDINEHTMDNFYSRDIYEANARAKMLVYLVTRRYINLKEVNNV